MSVDRDLLSDVAAYYSGKLDEHGVSARGVDWNSEASQELRFVQLSRIFGDATGFSLLDYGCGHGALVRFLRGRGTDCEYLGYDISGPMISAARTEHAERDSGRLRARFATEATELSVVDYVVASGVLNVRLGYSESQWVDYVQRTLSEFDRLSRRGYAFNMLTAYSDTEYMRDDLYYARPESIFEACMSRHPRRVALLHDYPLYEFTVLVRKDP